MLWAQPPLLPTLSLSPRDPQAHPSSAAARPWHCLALLSWAVRLPSTRLGGWKDAGLAPGAGGGLLPRCSEWALLGSGSVLLSSRH